MPLFALPHAFVRGRSNIGSGSLVSFCHFATLSSFHNLAGDKLRYCQPFQKIVNPFRKRQKKGDKETSGQGDIKVFAIVEKLMKQKDILYI